MIASMAFGSAYYMALGKQWMTAIGKSEAEIAAAGFQPGPFAIAIAAQLVMAFVLAGVIGHLGPDQVTVSNALISAAIVWAGFVLTSMLVNHRFQGATIAHSVIDGIHWLGVLLIQGLVIGLFGV